MSSVARVNSKIDKFYSEYPAKTFPKGHILIWAQEDPVGVVYLMKGRIDQYDIAPNGDKVIVNSFKPGAFFPMSWAVTQTPNSYFFEAAIDITVRIAPPDDVLDFLNSNTDVLHELLKRVYSGTEGMARRLAHAMGGSAKNRVLHALIIEARRFGKKLNGGYEIEISESKLGATTGLTRETVSRALKELAKDGLIVSRRQYIKILNLDKLESHLGSSL